MHEYKHIKDLYSVLIRYLPKLKSKLWYKNKLEVPGRRSVAYHFSAELNKIPRHDGYLLWVRVRPVSGPSLWILSGK